MDSSNQEIVTLLREQNELLRQISDGQSRQTKSQRHAEWLKAGIQLLPLVIVLVIVVWLYWSLSSTLFELTSQVHDIRQGVDSMFNLLTNQLTKLNEQFQGFLSSLQVLFPNFDNVTNVIKDQFLSS